VPPFRGEDAAYTYTMLSRRTRLAPDGPRRATRMAEMRLSRISRTHPAEAVVAARRGEARVREIRYEERERERERERVYACLYAYVCVCEREREREQSTDAHVFRGRVGAPECGRSGARALSFFFPLPRRERALMDSTGRPHAIKCKLINALA